MKNLTKALAGVALLVGLGVGSSQAQNHNYTNAVLNGCYGFLSNSVDVAPQTSTVGTICFDGNGHIIANVGNLDQTGWAQDSAGRTGFNAGVAGTYAITNFPGQGMGTFTFPLNGCVYYLSVNNVFEYGIALGFQFSLYPNVKCNNKLGDPLVLGGTAYIEP